MKAAFIALDECALWQVAMLQKILYQNRWAWRTLTLDGRPVITDGGIRLMPDSSVESASPRDYDLLAIAEGNVSPEQLEQTGLQRFLRQFDAQRSLITATGLAVVLLAGTGLLGGLRFTTNESVYYDFGKLFAHSIYTKEPVTVDGNIITAKEQAHLEFALAVCQHLGISEKNPASLRQARNLMRNE